MMSVATREPQSTTKRCEAAFPNGKPNLSEKRIYLAIDADNLYYGLQCGQRVHYDALLDYASTIGTCIRSAFYISKDADSTKEKGLLMALRFLGFTRIVARARHVLSNGKKKSDIDMMLALDVWKAALLQDIDALILVTGDSDYTPLVERIISECGIEVYLVGPDGSTSNDLIIAVNHFRNASDIPGLLKDMPWLVRENSESLPMAA